LALALGRTADPEAQVGDPGPLSYQSNRCPTLSSGSAMKPSTDIVRTAITLAIVNRTERAEPRQ